MKDGDARLLEPLYSYASDRKFSLSVHLWNKGREPADDINYTEVAIEQSTVNYLYGNWERLTCYNPDTRRIEPFNPLTLEPYPPEIAIWNNVEDYARMNNLIKKSREIGYTISKLSLFKPKDDEPSARLSLYGAYFAGNSISTFRIRGIAPKTKQIFTKYIPGMGEYPS